MALLPVRKPADEDEFATIDPTDSGSATSVVKPELEDPFATQEVVDNGPSAEDEFAVEELGAESEFSTEPLYKTRAKETQEPEQTAPQAQPTQTQVVQPQKIEPKKQKNARIDNYANAASESISELYGLPKEDALSWLNKLKEQTKSKYDSDLAGKEVSDQEYEDEYAKRFRTNIDEVFAQGSKMKVMGGPDAFKEGRQNADARKAARSRAIDDFDVNFISRAAGSGILQTAGGFVDFGATIADLVGADKASKYLTKKGKELAELNSLIPFKVQNIDDVQNVWDVGMLASKASIEMAPQVAVSYLAGGGASKLASWGGKLTKVGEKTARGVGSFLVNSALETGGNARAQVEDNGMIDAPVALAGGFLSGGLETAADMYLFKRLWPLMGVHEREMMLKDFAGKTSKEVIKQIGKYTFAETAKQVPVEFATEAAQEGINIASVELGRKDPGFFRSPQLDEKKFGRYTKQVLDAGIYGGLGSIGLTGTLTSVQGGLIARDANRLYSEMQQAKEEGRRAKEEQFENIRKAKQAEESGAPETARAIFERTDTGLIKTKQIPQQDVEETQDNEAEREPDVQAAPKEESLAEAPREGGSLSEFKFTDQVFKTQEEAEKFILSQKNPGDFEMMDNSDIDDEGNPLEEYIILKRDGAEMSIPQAEEEQINEEGPTEETAQIQAETAIDTADQEQIGQTQEIQGGAQQNQPDATPVQPEAPQPSQEAVAPTLVTQPTQQELAKQVGYPDPTKPPLPTFRNPLVSAPETEEKRRKPELEKSPGHVAFFDYENTTYELYKDAKGDLFRAPVSNVFDVNTGYRIGRWEAPAQMADKQAARILGQETKQEESKNKETKVEPLEKTQVELDDTDKEILRSKPEDFSNSVLAVLQDDSPEARQTAGNLLLARFQQAVERGDQAEKQAMVERLDAVTDLAEKKDGNKELAEKWRIERSVQGFMEGFNSSDGIGYLGKPGKAINKFVETFKGIPQFKEQVYDEMMTRAKSFVRGVKEGTRARTKMAPLEGKTKSPPVITDPYSEWVEYGKNWANKYSYGGSYDVGRRYGRDKARDVSFEGAAETRLGENADYTDDGAQVELNPKELSQEDREINEEETRYQNAALEAARQNLSRARGRFENDPVALAVYDATLGQMGVENPSGFDESTDDFDIAQDLKGRVLDSRGKPLETSTIQKRISEARTKQVNPEIEKALNLEKAGLREITKPEAVKKENRQRRVNSRELRAAKNAIYEKMRELQKDGEISYAQMQDGMDLVPETPNEETLANLGEYLDSIRSEESFDPEKFTDILKERIAKSEKTSAQTKTEEDARESLRRDVPDEPMVTGEQPAAHNAESSQRQGSDGTAIPGVEEAGGRETTKPESQKVDERVVEELRNASEALERRAEAAAKRARAAFQIGYINEDEARGVNDAILKAYADGSPAALEDAVGAIEAALDIAEAPEAAKKSGNVGSNGSVRPSVVGESGRAESDNAGVQAEAPSQTTEENRRAVQGPSGREATVPRGDALARRTVVNQKADEAGSVVDNGPRPPLETSFAAELPQPSKQYVRPGEFQLDDRQALAVNLMVEAWETGKNQDPKARKLGFILGDGTGIGKTLTYLVAGQKINEISGKKVLLLALNDTWLEQRYLSDIAKFGINPDAFLVATYPQLRKGMVEKAKENQEGFAAIIFDEAHALKNDQSLTAKAATKINSPFKIFATATPLDEPKQAAYFISELTGESEDQVLTNLGFRVRYDKDDYGQLVRRVQQVANPKDVKKALGLLGMTAARNGQYVRRYFPFWGKIRRVDVKLNPQQRKEYDKNMELWERKIALSENRMNAKGQRTQAMKRWTEIQKNQYVLDSALNWMNENPTGKVVIFSTTANKQKSQVSKDQELLGTAGFMSEELDKRGIKYVKLFGGNKNQKNTFEPLKTFQSRSLDVRVAIATLASGGTGIDLDDTFGDRPRLVLMAGTDFSASVVEQAMGRTSRRNTKSPSDLRLILVPESYGDQRASQIQEGKMGNLRSIQGQDIEEVEAESGGNLSGDISTIVQTTKGDDSVVLAKIEGVEVDSRVSSLSEPTQRTIRETAKLLLKNSPNGKIIFGEHDDNVAWADWTKGRTDVVYVNPEKLHQVIGEALNDPKTANTAREALELIVDEELSHNALFQSLFEEAASLGKDRYQHVLDEARDIHSGLTEEIKDMVRGIYEGVGGKILSNEHLAMEYIRMVHQWTRKGTTTENYFKPRAGTPTVFARLLPRSKVSQEGQLALAKLFKHILNFFKGLLRPGLSDAAAKQIQKRIESLDKVFQETTAPKLGSFGNSQIYDAGQTPSAVNRFDEGYLQSGQTLYRLNGTPSGLKPTILKDSEGNQVLPSGLDPEEAKKYERSRPLPPKLRTSQEIEENSLLKSAYDKMRGVEPPFHDELKYFVSRFKKGFLFNVFNHFEPIKQLEEEALTRLRQRHGEQYFPADASGHDLFPANESTYKMFVMAQNADSVVEEAFKRGIPIWRNGMVRIKEGTRGIIDIFRPLDNRDDAINFRLYLVARRAKELESQGKKSGFTESEIDEVLKKFGSRQAGKHIDGERPTFAEIFEQYREFQDGVLQFAVDSGLVSPELKELLNNLHKDYVPYYRISDAASDDFDSPEAFVKGPFSARQMAGQRSGIKRFTGSNKYINDPYENIAQNLAHLITASIRNLAMQRLEDLNTILTDEAGFNFWEPVSPMQKFLVPDKEIIKTIRKTGNEELAKELEINEGLVKMFGIGLKRLDDRATKTVSYVRNGKVQYRRIDEGNESLLNSLTITQDFFSQLARSKFARYGVNAPRKLLQNFITAGSEFVGGNVARDTVQAWVTNPFSFAPIKNVITGLIEKYKNPQLLAEMRLQGAGNPTNYRGKAGKNILFSKNPNLKPESENPLTRIAKTMTVPLVKGYEILEQIGQFSESASRLGTVIAATKAIPNLTDAEKAWIYRQSTTDFSLHGANWVVRALNMSVPFFQAGLNGLYRTYLATKGNQKDRMTGMNDFWYKASILGAATIGYCVLKALDPRYKDLPDDELDRYYVFFVNGIKLKIPKAQDLGTVFSTIPEHIVGMMMDGDIKKHGAAALYNIAGIFRFGGFQTIQPVLNLYQDKNFFTGRPILGKGLENLPPSLQTRESTPSVLSDVWADMPFIKDTPIIGSPAQMQSLIEGYFGTLGNYFLVTASTFVDMAKRKEYGEPPAKPSYETALGIRRFVQKAPEKNEVPTYRTRYAKDFYDIGELIKTADRTYSAAKSMTSQEKIDYYTGNYDLARDWSSTWRKASDEVNEINDAIAQVRKNKDLTGQQKQDQIDQLLRDRNQVMRDVTLSWEESEKKAKK